MKTKWKNLICAGLLSSALMFYGNAEAGVVTDRLPLQCYADHQVNTYNSPGAAKRAGYISANVDLIRITQVRGDGWCYGSYPGAGGKRVARWFRITDVCADAGYTNRSANVRGKQVVYRTRSGGATIGSVSNNEGVIVVADNGSRAQIVYRLDNGTGYKLGWVPSLAVAANPTPAPQSYNPQGNFEGISSPAAGQIRVEGWAADRDNIGASLKIHVYVGGPWNSGAESCEIVANKSRPDVRTWFNKQGIAAGEFYGFNNLINVKRTGRQEVYVYAINVGGGGNILLGHKTVDIKEAVSSNDYGKQVTDRMRYWSQNANGYKVNTKYTGTGECRGFANRIYASLFKVSNITGYTNNNYGATSYSGSRVIGTLHNFAVNNTAGVQKIFCNAKPGSFVQMGRRNSLNSTKTAPQPHSAIIFSVSSGGVEFYEANADGHNTIKVNYYSWADLANKNKGFTIYEPNNYVMK